MRISKPVSVLSALVLGVVILASTRATWFTARVSDAVGATSELGIQGTEALPGLGALGLAIVAAAVSLTMARAKTRFVYSILLALLSVGVGAVVLAALGDPLGAARAAIASNTSLAVSVAQAQSVTWLAISVLLACLALLALAALMWVGGKGWGVSQRFDRSRADARQTPGMARTVTRDAAGSSGTSGTATEGTATEGTATAAGNGSPESDVFLEPGFSDAAEDWDALSRGEDLR